MCIASRELASILEAFKGHLKDICVKFYRMSLALGPVSRFTALAEICADFATVLLVTKVQIAIKVIGIQLLCR